MDKFLTELNRITGEKYSFLKVHSVEVHIKESILEIILLIPQQIMDDNFSEDDKKAVLNAALKIIPYPFKVKIDYKKSFSDTAFIMRDILDYINVNFPALNSEIKESSVSISIFNDMVEITFSLENSAFSYMKNSGAEEKIKNFLSHRYTGKFDFHYIIREDTIKESEEEEEKPIPSSHFIRVNNLEKLVGKEISIRPKYIKDIKTEESRVVACGKIKSIYRNVKKETDNIYYQFTIDDTTGSIKALYFPKLWQPKDNDEKAFLKAKKEYEKKIEVFDKIVSDSAMGDYAVIIEGNTRFSRNDELTLFVNNLSSCTIDYSSILSIINKKKVPDNYTTVFPTPYIDTITKSGYIVPNYLKDKKIVVFDFETTGTDTVNDEPIEIGAVSIVNGKLSEQFSTFINPKRQIPKEITRITHISDTDVINAPYIEDIIPDFYKFSEGAVLVAHNAEFDYAFLKKAAHPMGCIFDNERQDTMLLSKKVFKNLDRYSLESLTNHLNIINEGAHRAIYDAIATARLYLILIEKM